jgi:hypothetical protein
MSDERESFGDLTSKAAHLLKSGKTLESWKRLSIEL